MNVSLEWLQAFFDEPLPDAEAIARTLTFGVAEIEGIETRGSDSIIDVKILPDRAHYLLCHRGVAKELSVLLDRPMKDDPLAHPPAPIAPASSALAVAIDDFARCPAYAALRIDGVKVGPSPAWLSRRLEAIGQRSINNIVDATNYVMFDLGTPLHAFDAKRLKEADGAIGIRVRAAREGEKITALGGAEYALTEAMTVIADAHSDAPLAIAGIKGGTAAEVTGATTSIVIEAAKFDPIRSRKTSQALKLRTDASYRFENEIADALPGYGLAAVATLITEIAGGTAVAEAHQTRPQPAAFRVGASLDEVNRRLGTELSSEMIEGIFARFGFSRETVPDPRALMLEKAASALDTPYKRGASVLRDAPRAFDCSSFTAWLAVQAGISIPRIAIDQFVFGTPVERDALQPGDLVFANTGIEKSTTGEYYSQVLDTIVTEKAIRTETLEWLPGTEVPGGVDHVGLYMGDGEVMHTSSSIGHMVREPLEASAQFRRIVGYRSIVADESLRFVVTVPFERLDIRQPADLIEEIGRAYGYGNIEAVPLPRAAAAPISNRKFAAMERAREALDASGFTELYTYSLRANGAIALANALASDKGHLRENLSDALSEKLAMNEPNLPLLGMDALAIYEIGNAFTGEGESLRLAVAARASSGKRHEADTRALLDLAQAGLEHAFGALDEPLFATDESREWDLNAVSQRMADGEADAYGALPATGIAYRPFSNYPFVLRDIAAWTPEGTAVEAFEEMIRKEAGDLLVRLSLFDQFTKEGKTSFAFHLVFQSYERTLSDGEVNNIMERIYKSCKLRGFEIR